MGDQKHRFNYYQSGVPAGVHLSSVWDSVQNVKSAGRAPKNPYVRIYPEDFADPDLRQKWINATGEITPVVIKMDGGRNTRKLRRHHKHNPDAHVLRVPGKPLTPQPAQHNKRLPKSEYTAMHAQYMRDHVWPWRERNRAKILKKCATLMQLDNADAQRLGVYMSALVDAGKWRDLAQIAHGRSMPEYASQSGLSGSGWSNQTLKILAGFQRDLKGAPLTFKAWRKASAA